MTLFVLFILPAIWSANCAFGGAGRLYKTLAADNSLQLKMPIEAIAAKRVEICMLKVSIVG